MAIRKQLYWDDTTPMWPITDASAIHYTFNPSDSNKVTSPVSGTSYGLDVFLNGLRDLYMTKDEVLAVAANISKGKGMLYNSAVNTTAVALPGSAVTNSFVRCTYTAAGALSFTFTTTNYAGSSSDGGAATAAAKLNGGGAGQLVYLSGANTTAFLAAGSNGLFLQYSTTNSKPLWVTIENYGTTTIAAANYSLTKDTWTAVSTDLSTTSGTYAIYIDDGTNGSYAGIFAIEGGKKEKLEEIPLHWATAATNTADSKRIYAAIQEGKIRLASSDSSATTYNLTIKYKRII